MSDRRPSLLRRLLLGLLPPRVVRLPPERGVVSLPTDGPAPDMAALFPARPAASRHGSGWERPVVAPPRDENRLPGVPDELGRVGVPTGYRALCVCGWRGQTRPTDYLAEYDAADHLAAHHHAHVVPEE